jgi:hypothetical protein
MIRTSVDMFAAMNKRYLAAFATLITTFVIGPVAAQTKTSGAPDATPGQVEFRAAVARAADDSTLAAPGGAAFHLKLSTADATMHSAAYAGEIEIWWETPERWRREIKFPGFTQSAVRDGADYWESSAPSDYLPYWVQELATAAIDPIPAGLLADVDPDKDGNGCWKWESEYGAAAEKFSAYRSVCFNPNGTAREILVHPPSVTLNGYEAFAGKMIARQLVVWRGERSDVTATVTVLEPLAAYAPRSGEFPGGVFAMARHSAFDARLRVVQIPESALEPATVGGNAPLTFPPSFIFPLSGVIAVTVEIDRNGAVRGFPLAISKNQGRNQAAIEQIKNWKFKTYLLDGAPVEVITTLSVPFHLKYEPLGAGGRVFPEISFGEHMAQSRALSDLRVADSKPYKLHATFTLADKRSGEYVETWGAPSTWVRKATMKDASAGQTEENGVIKNLRAPNDPPAPDLVAVVAAMRNHFPDLRTFQEADWGNSAVPESNVDPSFTGIAGPPELIRAARGGVNAANRPISGQAYWFDAAGLLRADFVGPMTTVYSDFQDWNGKQVPRVVKVYREAELVVTIRVDSIEAQ